ncbi:uncharacterized protein [Penaeus vannamei]|uniref:uncharacterized protein n=1 Tax=Penaeus vannamei TaxID=6689 RepID=UPI00387F9826
MRWSVQLLVVLATGNAVIFTVVQFTKPQPVQQGRADNLVVTPSVSFPGLARTRETPRKSCVPQDSVYFLKTPKCASSTFSQVFTAYGVKHGLTFALPIHYGRITISPKILPPEYHGAPDGRYHMVVSHTQFSKEGAEKASPSFNSFATSYTNFLLISSAN